MKDLFKRESHAAGVVVFHQGEPGDSAYVVEEGCVEIMTGPPTAQRRIAVLAKGAMFGEVALLDHQPRTATVRTVTTTQLIRIDRQHVEDLLLRADPVIQYLMRLLLARFRNVRGYPSHPAEASQANVLEGDPQDEVSSIQDLQNAAVRTLTLAQDLTDAINLAQLETFYQPLIAFASLQPIGFEALVRWRHPTLGLISPMEFIPLAEKTGLIHRIGAHVMQTAAKDWRALRGFCLGTPGVKPFMSVNLSSPELSAPGIVPSIAKCLVDCQMTGAELRIELTETIVINNMDRVAATFEALRGLGAEVALDDFGTGYAGLDYLQSLPFSCLKIDKVFVQNMLSSDRSFHIVQSALELARSLGLTTVAEGIEDPAIGQRLAQLGCTYAQGYCYGKPMPVQDIAAWHAAYSAKLQ
jgi:diguanylate cyclase